MHGEERGDEKGMVTPPAAKRSVDEVVAAQLWDDDPPRGRIFSARRRIRLSDLDARGRLRLDGVARFLQDMAIDDVQEKGLADSLLGRSRSRRSARWSGRRRGRGGRA
jgi:hypothetical protein